MIYNSLGGNVVKEYAMRQVYNDLKEFGFLKEKIMMKPLTYKGYIGTVNFSDKDNVFFGKIEKIDGLVNFESESVNELTNAFHQAVDDYLEYCIMENVEPRKSYTGNLYVRVSPETHSRIAILAKQMGISINAFIKEALDKQLASML